MDFKLSQALRRIWLILAVAGVVIALDQWTKEWVRDTIPKFHYIAPIPALDPYFVFEHVDNYGAAFGIFQGGQGFFIAVAAVVSLGILYYALRHLPEDQTFLRVLLGLQMGGALGNVIDRINQGYVTDFVKVGVPGVYYWPNFNVADSAIVSGVIGLAALIIWQDVQHQRALKADGTEEASQASPHSSEA